MTKVILWVLALGTFCATYSLLSSGTESRAIPVGIGLSIAAGAFVVLVVWNLKRFHRAHSDGVAGINALASGDLALAHDLFKRWAEETGFRLAAANARHNLGWTLMRMGQLEDAVSVATDNDTAHARELKRMAMYPTSAVDIALYFALLGKLDDAKAWLQRAEERSKLATLPGLAAMKVFARAAIECRDGKPDAAARLLDEQWSMCEATLTGETTRPIRVLRAFAHASTGERQAGVAEMHLASALPARSGEYDFLAIAWPEMARFLDAHAVRSPSALT